MLQENPDMADRIISIKEKEVENAKEIIELEKREQDSRLNELPFIRKYTFRGQAMAYSLALFSIVGAVYFGNHDKTGLAIAFLTSAFAVGAVQFINTKQKD